VRRTIHLHHPGAAIPETAALAAPTTAGGSAADPIHLPGLPPAVLGLTPCAAGVVVEARTTGVRAGGHPLEPGGRRLLRPGERAELFGAAVSVPEEPAPEGTRVLAAGLLRAVAAGEPPVTGPHLLVLTGPDAGARLPLGSDQVLGRGARAGIRLRDPLVSRRHARLRVEGGAAVLDDLGAKNGVTVDGVRVDRRPVRLRDGAELRLGGTILALVLPAAATTDPGDPRAGEGGAEAPRPPPATGPRRPRRRRAVPRPIAAAALLAASAAALALSGL
jgi:hypothetical protein